MAVQVFSAKRFQQAHQGLHKGRLSAAVGADDADPVTAPHGHGDFRKRMIISDRKMIGFKNLFTALHPRGELHMEGFVIRTGRLFQFFHPVEVFDLRLGKRRLVLLVAELFDQRFQAFDIFLLAVVCGGLPFNAVFLLFDIRGIVAGILCHRAVFHVIDHIGDMVEKHPVMADNDYGLGILAHIAFEPFDRFKIEMVGWFVQ